ncbi:unnamed protein product, partial [Rotaria socialis]
MKWNKGAKEGILVAGGKGKGSALTQMDRPNALFTDTLGDMKQGTVIMGGNGGGTAANQFNIPIGLSFDRHGNLYVADFGGQRVQRFSIEKDFVALAGRCFHQPARFRHRNMYLISKDHLPL